MSKKNLIIGITGRTGSGKSLACTWIKNNIDEVEHIDCDKIGHHVLKNTEIKKKLTKAFGSTILDDSGEVYRPTLRDIVFNDDSKLMTLNDLVHPEICHQVYTTIKNTTIKTIIIEGALIHLVGLEDICDHTICIDSPSNKIIERQPNKQNILSKQPNAKDYINMCSYTVKNNTTVDLFHEKLAQLFDRLSIR